MSKFNYLHDELSLSNAVGNGLLIKNGANKPKDVRAVRQSLASLGVLENQEKETDIDFITHGLDNGIKKFQRQNNLKPDGFIQPYGPTRQKVNEKLRDQQRLKPLPVIKKQPESKLSEAEKRRKCYQLNIRLQNLQLHEESLRKSAREQNKKMDDILIKIQELEKKRPSHAFGLAQDVASSFFGAKGKMGIGGAVQSGLLGGYKIVDNEVKINRLSEQYKVHLDLRTYYYDEVKKNSKVIQDIRRQIQECSQ